MAALNECGGIRQPEIQSSQQKTVWQNTKRFCVFQAAFLCRGKAGQGGCLRLRAYHSNSNLKMGKNVVATRLPSREAA